MTFNLFSNVDSSNDDDDVRYELITTRLFLLLMAGALAVLIFYTGLSLQQKTVFIDSPSLATLLDLISSITQGNDLIPMFDSHFLVERHQYARQKSAFMTARMVILFYLLLTDSEQDIGN
ncbi:unnamed protein product [Didymodactylos carnosus]|uniref:Uncharacterized protein n=1 Tax=Didymodactylos carnosus TaxID=1234261 RepID=A0A8S2VSI1_9BILA|nr:unnamed protein product [Didymodactylos carnosus]